jgi:hypothetical protein
MNPPFNANLIDQAQKVARDWAAWFQGVTGGGKITTLTAGVSPYTYQNTSNSKQQIIVTGGTVSSVQYSRDNLTFYVLPAYQIVLFPGDYLKITYTVAPTLVIAPI